jgi:hypothetical protein
MEPKYVAVEIDGEISVHLPHQNGNWYTLCGIDGDDPANSQYTVDVPEGAKVDCISCFRIWNVARKYRISDFQRRT